MKKDFSDIKHLAEGEVCTMCVSFSTDINKSPCDKCSCIYNGKYSYFEKV